MSGQFIFEMAISLCLGAVILLSIMIEGPFANAWQELRQKFGGKPPLMIQKVIGFIGVNFASGFFMFEIWSVVQQGRPKENFSEMLVVLVMLYGCWYFIVRHLKSRYSMDFVALAAGWRNWKLTLLDIVPPFVSSAVSIKIFLHFI